jgi:cation transport ATPase
MAAAGIAVHLILRFSSANLRHWADVPLYVTLLAGGLPLVVQLARKLWAWEFGSDFLAGVSIVTAVLLRQYLVAAIVVLMLSGGTALEEFASRRASRMLGELAKRMPSIAHRRADQGLVDIPAGRIVVGDTVVVFPHEICPVDGIVIEGRGMECSPHFLDLRILREPIAVFS